MVSPKAARELGDKFGTQAGVRGALQVRRARGPGQDRASSASPTTGTRAASTSTASSSCPSSTRPRAWPACARAICSMIERVSPADLAQIRGDSRLKVAGVPELGYQVIRSTSNNGPRGKALGATRGCARPSTSPSTARRSSKAVFNNEYIPGNQWVSPASPTTTRSSRCRKRDVARARQLLREAGQPNLAFTLILPPERDRQEAAPGHPGHAGRGRHHHEPPDAGKRHHAARRAKKGDFEAYFTFWSGRPDPDGNVFTRTSSARAPRTTATTATRDLDALLTKARQVADPARNARSSTTRPSRSCCGIRPRCMLWHRRVFTGLQRQGAGLHAASRRDHPLCGPQAEPEPVTRSALRRARGWRCWCRRSSSSRC